MWKATSLILLLILGPLNPPRAQAVCDQEISLLDRDPKALREQIIKLAPLVLEGRRLSPQKLFKKIQSLKAEFGELKSLRRDYENGLIDPRETYVRLVKLQTRYSLKAAVLLEKGKLTLKDRSLLEGYRLLFLRAEKQRAEIMEEAEPPPPPPAGSKGGSGKQKGKGKGKTKDGKNASGESPDADQRESETSEGADEASQDRQTGEQGQDSKTSSQGEPSAGNSGKPSKKGDDEKEGDDGKGKGSKGGDSQDKSKGEGQSEGGENGKDGKGQAKGASKGKGKSNGADGKGQSDDDLQGGEGVGGKGRRKWKKREKTKTTERVPLEESGGSDSQVEGGKTGTQLLGRDLVTYVQSLFGVGVKPAEGRHAEPAPALESKEHFNEEKKGVKPRVKKAPKNKKSDFQFDHAEAFQATIDLLWNQALRQYGNAAKLQNALMQFQQTARELLARFPQSHFLRQYAERADDIQQQLSMAQLRYSGLDQLGLSLMLGTGGGQRMRQLKFLERVLSELHQSRDLTAREEQVLVMVKNLLSEAGFKPAKPSDQQLGEAFMQQLPGPLSRKVLKDHYLISSGGFDWSRLAMDLRAGRLNDLLLESRLNPLLNILFAQTASPQEKKVFRGDKVPVNESDPDLQLATELDGIEQFYRDGTPMDLDFIRVVSGDMLENLYRDQVKKPIRQKPKPKKVTVIAYDVSGSTQTNDKWLLRNLLIATYLDRVQNEMLRGESEHVVYLLAFDALAHPHQRIARLNEAMAYFNQARSHPVKYGGDDNVSGVLQTVYDLIALHNREGGEAKRANILLITDAVAAMDLKEIEESRRQINPEVELMLNAISMGDLNSDMRPLMRLHSSLGGQSFHQHIGYEQIAALLHAPGYLKTLEAVSSEYGVTLPVSMGGNGFEELKAGLTGLGMDSQAVQPSTLLGSRRWLAILDEFPSNPPASPSPFQELLMIYLNAMDSPLNGVVSEPERLKGVERFLDLSAQRFRVSQEQLLAQLDGDSRRRFRRWIGGG